MGKKTYALFCLFSLVAMLVMTACGGSKSEAPAEANTAPEAPTADEQTAQESETVDAGKAAVEKEMVEAPSAKEAELAQIKTDALANYADIVYASYEDSLLLAIELRDAVNAFVDAPSEETHQAAKDAWLAANEPYGQTEAYRFYGGPIDGAGGPESLMNAWPLDEAYVDYVKGDENAGIINQAAEFPELDKELLASLNEVGAEENISVGYHAIEFLLWGQDFYEDGPGQRPYTDYVRDGTGTAANQERRGAYLKAAAALLVDNLSEVTEAWGPGDGSTTDNYREIFLALDPNEALGMVLTGMGVLSKAELAGERLFTAYDNQDQEDEHSCFSDNTHRDIVTNNQGIYNVYHGRYTRLEGTVISGTSVADVIEAIDPTLNQEMIALLDQSMTHVNAIYVPFDQAIVLPEEREQVLETVFILQDQGNKLAEVASAVGLSINTTLP